MRIVEIKIPSRRRKKDPRYVVIDMETGRVGHLRENPGYTYRGDGYVNPSWSPVFPDSEDG